MTAVHPPKMDRLLDSIGAKALITEYGRRAVKKAIGEALSKLVDQWRNGDKVPCEETVIAAARSGLKGSFRPVLRRVVNGSGVVLHTNLGRAPIPGEAFSRASEQLSGYSDLEIDLDADRRGHRDLRIERYFQDLLDTNYRTIVVNNNAGAVLLLLNTLSFGRECLVSRGELVEIGGGFRMPEVMLASGSILKEVGTTNRTRIVDYENACGDRSGMLLKVHTSNYRVLGFTETVSLEELTALGKKTGLPVGFDLGSGMVMEEIPPALSGEPTVRSALAGAPDAITFSADKLLGGCQAGIILAKPGVAERFRTNPLLRALRVDKTTYFLLGEILDLYRRGRENEIPAIAMLKRSAKTLREKAENLASRLENLVPGLFEIEVAEAEGRVGAGSAPLTPLSSPALSIIPVGGGAGALNAFLRTGGDPPILTVISNDRVLIHLRTLLEGDDELLLKRLCSYKEG